MNPWTELTQNHQFAQDPCHANCAPLYQTATFGQSDGLGQDEFDYSRSGNPTRQVLEQKLAQLEKGQHGFAFNSGLAALNAVFELCQNGDHVLVSQDLYGGTDRLLTQIIERRGIRFSLVDSTDIQAVTQAYTVKTKLLLIETPSNPLQQISDVRALADWAKAHDVIFAVDNSFLSAWLQKPLTLGADIAVSSATKHLSGHGDLTAGAVVTNREDLASRFAFIQNATGSALAPFPAWLLLRGMKTLGLRIEHQQKTAGQLAQFLAAHSAVTRVYYAGLSAHQGHTLHHQQAAGAGTVMSFTTGNVALSQQVVRDTTLFATTVSFGSVSSTISLPCYMSHASRVEARKPAEDLVRLSVGIENVEDLLVDLDRQLTGLHQFSIAS